MATNFVQLNQGLRSLGNSVASAGEFAQNERRLDLADREMKVAEDTAAINNETKAYDLRMRKMQEHGRTLLATVNEATQSRKPDGSRYNTLGEYLDSDQGAAAAERMVQSLADTNSQYKKTLGGRPVRTLKGPEGRYQVHVQEGDQWTQLTDESGVPVTFSGQELAQRSRLDAASAGLAELIYFKRDAQRKFEAGQIPRAEYETIVTQTRDQGEQILAGAERLGIPREEVINTSRQGSAGYAQMASDEDLQAYAANGGGRALGGEDQPVVDEAMGRPALGDLDSFMPERQPGQSTASILGASTRGVFDATVGQVAGRAKDAVTAAVDSVSQFAKGFTGQPPSAGGQKPAEALPPNIQTWTQANIPPSVAQQKAVVPTTQNTAPGPTAIRVARTEKALDTALTGSPEDARDAAIQYANASAILGIAPNPGIMANLYAGDDMRGSAREAAIWQAKMDMDFARSYRTAQRSGTQDLSNQLKMRDQILQEQKVVSSAAAEAAVRGDAKDRNGKVKQLEGLITQGFGTYRNEFANLGVDTAGLPMSMATFPMVADLLAKYHSRDLADRAHNSNLGWFGVAKEPKTLMAYINKTIALADPEGTFATIRQGLQASPGNANMSPEELDEAARTIYRSFNDPDIDLEARP